MAKATKAKNKGGNKKKPAKAKKAKASAKAKAPKAPKEKKDKAPKVAVSSPVVKSEQPKARVVESPKEEREAVTTAPPVASVTQVEPDAIDLMAKSLNKTVLSYERGITKAMLEDYLSKLPNNLPYYVTAKYTENAFTIEITDGTKKVTIPSTGAYALVG